ncbi:MAG: T9SS type A sorting domain-containing protein [Saprospiraceae bacterium]|nr:T9SS type A sorting domain-containing protein [Saprospiraceae bacterium]
MKKNPFLFLLLIFLVSGVTGLHAQSLFHITTEKGADLIDKAKVFVNPTKKIYFNYDMPGLRAALNRAPREADYNKGLPGIKLSIPNPDGGLTVFDVYESPILSEPEYSRYPDIRTYIVVNQQHKLEHGRIDVTEQGFHALIFTEGDVYLIEPASLNNLKTCIVYYKKDNHQKSDFECHVEGSTPDGYEGLNFRSTLNCNSTTNLISYRTAVACAYEYAEFHGGTTALALSAVTTTVNRVSALYENDFGVRLILIANNSDILFTPENTQNASSDPYSNSNGGTMLNENRDILKKYIGASNYDIGYVVSTGGGGVAYLGVICKNTPGSGNSNNDNNKARGVTGSGSLVGDAFDIDYVAHEMGHQFGGNHTFNGNAGSCSGNRNGTTAYEPGSGSTIMAYAGICSPQDLQPHSDAYFTNVSLYEAITQINSPTTCYANVSGTSNTSPQITGFTTGKTIPANTPFFMDATATDADNDVITYCWEENDLGPAGYINASSTKAPIFRSFYPVTSGRRYFPRLQDVLNGASSYGEVLPAVARTLNFVVTGRDNHATGGAICRQEASITIVANSGFAVTAPNSSVTWSSPGTGTISWNVNGTDQAPVSCAQVDIQVSFDNGLSWITIGNNEDNDGEYVWNIPANINSSDVRFRVVCSDNIFYAVNTTPITIGNPVNNCYSYSSTTPVDIPADNPGIFTSSITIADRDTDEVVKDVNITNINISHTAVGDLQLNLQSENGGNNILMQGKCGNQNNVNLGFDDEASSSTISCPATGGTIYKPQEFLNIHDGVPANSTWNLTVHDWAAGDGGTINSWSIQICVEAKTPLPLELLDFSATSVKDGVYLSWRTAQEKEVAEYLVEKQAEDGSYVEMGRLSARNLSGEYSYGLMDEHPSAGVNYYRLKIIDNNGKIGYSRWASVTFKNSQSIEIFPNPAGDFITVRNTGVSDNAGSVDIYDLSGNLVFRQSLTLPSGEKAELNISGLKSGIYLVRISGGTKVENVKLVKI